MGNEHGLTKRRLSLGTRFFEFTNGTDVFYVGIFRVKKVKDYTTISNYHLRDKGLSLKAKGLLTLILADVYKRQDSSSPPSSVSSLALASSSHAVSSA